MMYFCCCCCTLSVAVDEGKLNVMLNMVGEWFETMRPVLWGGNGQPNHVGLVWMNITSEHRIRIHCILAQHFAAEAPHTDEMEMRQFMRVFPFHSIDHVMSEIGLKSIRTVTDCHITMTNVNSDQIANQ